MIEVKYCMAMVFMFVKVLCIADSLIWNVFLKKSNDGIWMEPQTPAVMTIMGETFHPLLLISSRRGMYLLIFCSMCSIGNLSFVYVNSMNYIVYLGLGSVGCRAWYGNPLTYSIYGLNGVL